FTISDPRGNVIFKQTEHTSKFGISAVDCPLAEEVTEGTYMIGCKMGDTKSSLAVEVKRYVLPRFKVEVTADRPYYLPGRRVRGKLHARSFFGKPVADAAVEIAIRARAPQKTRTDERGEASFDFPPMTPGGEESERVPLVVVVTDNAGQKETKQSAVVF